MSRLFVLYDNRCSLCCRLRAWAQLQAQWIPLDFLPASSERARRVFPTLAATDVPEELIAITDEGGVYKDSAAWIMCLYALRDYRAWAMRLARPALLPLARQAFHIVSTKRQHISRLLGEADGVVARQLGLEPAPACERSPIPARTVSSQENAR